MNITFYRFHVNHFFKDKNYLTCKSTNIPVYSVCVFGALIKIDGAIRIGKIYPEPKFG